MYLFFLKIANKSYALAIPTGGYFCRCDEADAQAATEESLWKLKATFFLMALVRTIAKQGDPKTGRVLDEIIRDIEYLTAPHAYRSPLLAAAESYDQTKASATAAMTFVASLPTTYLEHFPADLKEETAEVSTCC